MSSVTASEAKQNFGKVISNSQHEPVAITKHGEDVCVVLSAAQYAEDQRHYDFFVAQSVHRGLEDIKAGRTYTPDEVRERMAQRYAELRKVEARK